MIAEARKVGKSGSQIFNDILFHAFIIVFSILIAKSPAALGLFWISLKTLHFVECILLDSIRVRRFLRIPKTIYEPANIYKFKYDVVLRGFKNLFKKFKK